MTLCCAGNTLDRMAPHEVQDASPHIPTHIPTVETLTEAGAVRCAAIGLFG